MNTILIAGALGTVGRSALVHFEGLPDWEVLALSRRKPDFETRARWLSIDLAAEDAAQNLRDALATSGVTHVFYAALYEMENVVGGWTQWQHVETNLAMLRAVVEAAEATSPGFRHITVVHGAKHYGAHLGPFRMPARESDPRAMPPNFYYGQQDYLAERQRGKDWAWTVLIPQVVFGEAVGSPLNIVPAIGVFAAISRECGMPLRFPGGPARANEATDARLIAKAAEWAAGAPAARNQLFNVSNGDVYIWEMLWPKIARLFGMEVGYAQPFSLARVMPANGRIWDRMVAKYDLEPLGYDQIVPSWQMADFLFGYAQRPNPHHLSTIKIRKAGFHECQDSEEMILDHLSTLQRRRYLPA